MFSLEKKYHTSNKYSGSDWNYEETTKYVFSFDLGYVEAGYFIHYLESENGIIEKKHVIELPSSYGCPMKCAFCASSLISNVKPLSSNEIYKIFYYIYENNHLTENKSLLVSMKGIGDLYFTIDSVLGAIKQMASVNKKITFSVSSCYWTYDMLKKVENMSTEVLFRSIQFTYVSYDNDVLKNIINEVLGELSNTDEKITIKVAPDDVDFARASLPEIIQANKIEAKVAITPDESIEKGSCMVVSSNGVVDANFSTQLQIIQNAFGIYNGGQ